MHKLSLDLQDYEFAEFDQRIRDYNRRHGTDFSIRPFLKFAAKQLLKADEQEAIRPENE
jgi:hypothetical protein